MRKPLFQRIGFIACLLLLNQCLMIEQLNQDEDAGFDVSLLVLLGLGGVPNGSTNTIGVPQGFIASGVYQAVELQWSAVAGASTYNLYWSTSANPSIANANKIENVSSPYVHGGLTNGTNYYYIVTAVSGSTQSNPSTSVGATPQNIAPDAPALAITAGDTQNSLSWNAVTGAVSYTIYWASSSGVTSGSTSISGLTGLSYTHTGRTNNTTYYYKITAVNPAGESPLSAEVNGTPSEPPPGVAASVNATSGDTQIQISWSLASGADSYNIYWNTSGSVTSGDNKISNVTSTYTHTGRTNGTAYYYRVEAVNTGGSTLSAEASATPLPPAPSGAPASFTATKGDGQ
ncbi:MAG: fibronectin type III domain-containing protein, partial [Leptospiraceae bacterium]|nr:fibronectin type III domain-containing protein [Leptospiraceae bacterium]